jgi:hypothetical protein
MVEPGFADDRHWISAVVHDGQLAIWHMTREACCRGPYGIGCAEKLPVALLQGESEPVDVPLFVIPRALVGHVTRAFARVPCDAPGIW